MEWGGGYVLIKDGDSYVGPSYTFGHRFKRQLWNFTYITLFRISPRPFHCWRAFLLRMFGAKLGSDCHVYPGVKIWAPWNLQMGSFIGVGDGANLYCMDRIQIGDYAVISQGAHLCGGTHDFNSENFQLVVKPIVIGAHAWVCAESFIHPGVTISDGVVVGARSVVTKNLDQPWSVYAGHPCKKIGLRQKNSKS